MHLSTWKLSYRCSDNCNSMHEYILEHFVCITILSIFVHVFIHETLIFITFFLVHNYAQVWNTVLVLAHIHFVIGWCVVALPFCASIIFMYNVHRKFSYDRHVTICLSV